MPSDLDAAAQMQLIEKEKLMFTENVRSTSLIDAIGDETWNHLVHWHDKTLRSLFKTHGGKENDHAGDGLFFI